MNTDNFSNMIWESSYLQLLQNYYKLAEEYRAAVNRNLFLSEQLVDHSKKEL